MTANWEAVQGAAQGLCPSGASRLANLSIAAAAYFQSRVRRRVAWSASTLQQSITDLALDALPKMNSDVRQWQRLADLAAEAAYLGRSAEAMHSWAAAYQRATSTQKALGAYATHFQFASALADISFAPLDKHRIHRVIDPSVGAGNLLLAAIERFGRTGTDAHRKRFILSLYGVELDPCARELCCLLIWLIGSSCGVTLKQIAKNIRIANALTLDWWGSGELYEILLMNPPWESLRQAVNDDPGEERAKTIARMASPQAGAPGLPPLYTAQGTGDRNLFKAFVELVPHLLVDGGRVGALLPAAFASDAGMTQLRELYLSQFSIAKWTGFENRAGYFPIDSRYKFGLLDATRSPGGTRLLSVRSFAIHPSETTQEHIVLNRNDISLIGRRYHIIPELSKPSELNVLRAALGSGTALFSRGALGTVVYRREIDLSLGKAQFQHVSSRRLRSCGDGTFSDDNGASFVPLLEGRSVGAYDCFQKSWVSGSGRTAVWRENNRQPLATCKPQYVVSPVEGLPPRVALCDVTASTNTRTVIATRVPQSWRCGNTAPVLQFESETHAFAGLGILNTMVFDWVARRLASGLHLNKFILEGLVWPKLVEGDVKRAAYFAWSVCRGMPRSGLTSDEAAVPPFEMSDQVFNRPCDMQFALVSLEVLTARGLGLSAEQLRIIYDDDRTDRRGFWRYFDSNPEAKSVAGQAITALQALEASGTRRRDTSQV